MSVNKGKQAVVLLVDDEKDFLESMAKSLQRRNFNTVQADRGMKALNIVREQEIDVVILDVKLPDIDGHRLFYAIKEERPGVPIIMLTGHGSLNKAFELGRHGVFEYLGKPCGIDELCDCIHRALKEDDKEFLSNDAAIDPIDAMMIKVLLVDDEGEFLVSAAKALSRRGFNIKTAMDGSEALDIIEKRKIDVAVVDIKMPGIDGATLLKKIKKFNEDIEVILLTGHATIDTAVTGMKDGAFDYLIKPQDINELASKIRKAAEKKKLAEEKMQKKMLRKIVENSPT